MEINESALHEKEFVAVAVTLCELGLRTLYLKLSVVEVKVTLSKNCYMLMVIIIKIMR